jgi:haloacetate dehalogenase
LNERTVSGVLPSEPSKGDGADIFVRTGGSGNPLLLIHGFPQTGAMWHKIAQQLAEHFFVVIPDMRGYGRSSKPANTADNLAYSKRAMANDLVAVMERLGHGRFAVAGHDRGGRVAYRMALDHHAQVETLVTLDIVPTVEQWNMLARVRRRRRQLSLAVPCPSASVSRAHDRGQRRFLP